MDVLRCCPLLSEIMFHREAVVARAVLLMDLRALGNMEAVRQKNNACRMMSVKLKEQN